MSAHPAHPRPGAVREGNIDAHDAAPYLLGGLVIGAVALVFSAVIDGMMLALADHVSGGEMCGQGFSTALIALLTLIAIAISVAVGYWLIGWRKWIGTKADPNDPTDLEVARRQRKYFTVSALSVYVLLTPGLWALVMAASNCAGG